VPAHHEFVALGVAAEIVVVVENEDFGVRVAVLIEQGGAQPADAAAHDDQIVSLAGRACQRLADLFAIAQGVGDLERAGVGAAHAGAQRRIEAARFGRVEAAWRGRPVWGAAQSRGQSRGQCGACRSGGADERAP
jgi:hypothetical protein